MIRIVGTLRRRALGGGCWVLEAERGGETYLLVGGSSGDYREGRVVEVSGRLLEDEMDLFMVGPRLEVERIRDAR